MRDRTRGIQSFDRDGALAAAGRVDDALLHAMLGDAYFEASPPKTTGREHFGVQFLGLHGEALVQLSLEDGAATLTELTAVTIAQAIAREGFGGARVFVSGGGARNAVLLSRLAARLGRSQVETTDAMGIPVDAKEAIVFAVLGYETLRGRAGQRARRNRCRAPSRARCDCALPVARAARADRIRMHRRGVSSELPPTEAISARSAGLDLLSTPRLVELLIAEQREAVDAAMARKARSAKRSTRSRRVSSVGAPSTTSAPARSGRLAMLDAAEMPPTFGTPPELVRAHLAGGTPALTRSIEGAEDDAAAGDAATRESVSSRDAVVGISASGGAAFVVAAIERARALGAYTVALTGSQHSALARAANAAIVLETGAEALSGSTRMKAGTAQKIVLNAISTAVMVRIGRVYDNLMVDLVASNAKLRGRAVRMVRAIADVDEPRALELLADAGGHVKMAIVMARRDVDAAQARALLDRANGSLRALL